MPPPMITPRTFKPRTVNSVHHGFSYSTFQNGLCVKISFDFMGSKAQFDLWVL